MILFSEKDVPSLTTKVAGIISGIVWPFIGVDGIDACPDIYTSDGTARAGCPLNAGTQYMYKTLMKVLPTYPSVSTCFCKVFVK